MPRFFVSHKESDSELAEATVNLLLESFEVENDEVFCSSVPGHSLRFGSTIEGQIRDDLRDGDVLWALLTKDSLRSTWVLFELGAWTALVGVSGRNRSGLATRGGGGARDRHAWRGSSPHDDRRTPPSREGAQRGPSAGGAADAAATPRHSLAGDDALGSRGRDRGDVAVEHRAGERI